MKPRFAWRASRGDAGTHLAGPRTWIVAGIAVGGLLALLRFAPAAWAAGLVASATQGRIVLADAEGTVWDGDALVVLTGGAGSRDAVAMPSRLRWTLRPALGGVDLRLTQACCLPQPLAGRVRPGWRRLRVDLGGAASTAAAADAADSADATDAADPRIALLAQWPAGWLVGFGTPWNTLRPGGLLQLSSPGLGAEWRDGRWRLDGRATVELLHASSRVSTLDDLGSYRLALAAATASEEAGLTLSTLEGALQLSGSGRLSPAGVRFRGEARAAAGGESGLDNLLNLIGRRSGGAAVISIGSP